MDSRSNLELDRPRSIRELIGASFELYLRVPVLFIVLAAVVVVPWEVILLLVTGDGPLAIGRAGFPETNLITALDSFLVTPLISALHVHAIREVGDGRRPRLLPTFRQSLSTLPVVAIATGISWIGVLVGCLLVVPGLLLWARWAVVAQTAALEGGGWKDALGRSADLTKGYRWHALGLIFAGVLLTMVPSLAVAAVFGHKTTTIASFVSGTALQVVVRSFEALTVALLYFDLKARVGTEPAVPTSAGRAVSHSADPRNYGDEDRPAGWYIDPSSSGRMHYWIAEGDRGWSESTTATPKETLHEWQGRRQRDGQAPPATLDPRSYGDQDRPAGWYVDPSSPKIMRYWFTDPHWAWGEQTTVTPKQTLCDWEALLERGEAGPPASLSGRAVEPRGHPLDPASYNDEDRPAGCYVIPDAPWRMRYWAADGTPTWSKRKAKTPSQVQAEWKDTRWTRARAGDDGTA